MASSDESASITGVQIHTEARPVTNTHELTTATTVAASTTEPAKPDIEHVMVYDDPRQWSDARKVRSNPVRIHLHDYLMGICI